MKHNRSSSILKGFNVLALLMIGLFFVQCTTQDIDTLPPYQADNDFDEVDEGRWWELTDIDANLGKGIFTPNFESEFQMIRRSLLALL